jgi:hypothetical protein
VPIDQTKVDIDFAPVDLTPPAVVPGGGTSQEVDGTNLHIPVRLSHPPTAPVTVQWNTVFINAGSPIEADPTSDYNPASGTAFFELGQTTAFITLYVRYDQIPEPNEWIVVRFHDPTNATIGGYGGLGLGVIIDDDRSTVLPGGGSVLEGNSGTTQLDVPVSLSRPSTLPVTVQWNTVFLNAGSAIEADPTSDYTPASGTVTFAPGETAKKVPISVNGDTLVEPNEWIVISFHDAFVANIGGYGGLGFGVITNDDN